MPKRKTKLQREVSKIEREMRAQLNVGPDILRRTFQRRPPAPRSRRTRGR